MYSTVAYLQKYKFKIRKAYCVAVLTYKFDFNKQYFFLCIQLMFLFL